MAGMSGCDGEEALIGGLSGLSSNCGMGMLVALLSVALGLWASAKGPSVMSAVATEA